MLSFSPRLRAMHFTPQLHEVLQHASVWSLMTGIDVMVSASDDADLANTIGELLGRSLTLNFTVRDDSLADLELLHAHLRFVLPPQFGVRLRVMRVEVNWDWRRRDPQRSGR